jgi:predicted ATP-grasp superfamily ATP-dependent carboligase
MYPIISNKRGETILYKIWFNRWFSVGYQYVNMIRNNPDNLQFKIYGTHPDKAHMLLQACDHVEQEPVTSGSEYIEFCLEFVQRHKIDLFIPRQNMLDIVRHIDKFEALGTKVLAIQDYEFLKIVNDKDLFYQLCASKELIDIPEYYIAKDEKEFLDVYDILHNQGKQVCFKPVSGEGGEGFRIIDPNIKPVNMFLNAHNTRISIEQVRAFIKSVPDMPRLMVMEYLNGQEYSIDCIVHQNELLTAIPRRKIRGRIRYLENNKELINIAKKFAEKFDLPTIFNLQVIYKDGIPHLLEINPRMSGGLHFSSLSGINLPYYAVKTFLKGRSELPEPRLDIYTSHVENAFILSL